MVVDSSGKIYGHIVAGDLQNGLGYIIPAFETVADMKRQDGDDRDFTPPKREVSEIPTDSVTRQEDDLEIRDSVNPSVKKSVDRRTSSGVGTFSAVTVEKLDPHTPKNSLTPLVKVTNEEHPRGIYWHTPVKMVSFFIFGLVCSIAHHFYYESLNGVKVGTSDNQQWALRYVDVSLEA